ncbi:MAG: amidase [Candidatus Dormibacteraeota bacterium]|nr:amidase [Candidatus Dormibacteraeota bacterium]
MFPHPELADASVAELRARLDSGELSVGRLAEMHLERIAALNREGPELRAVLEVDPAWEEAATELEAELRRGAARGPLHGIPALIKDNVDTRTMLTTAGSLALAGAPARADAPLVARMRAAGMLILGKANLSEWANFRSTRSSSGWSGRGRQCRNPHVLDRSPAGSSSGSAVAVAAGLAPLAVGTETDGSIIGPSAANGVVGLKPGVGVISQAGIIPIARSQDSAGPHARSVRDAAQLLQVLADHPADLTAHLNEGALRSRRIGVLRDLYTGYSIHSDRLFEDNLAALRELGAELIDPVSIDTAGEMHDRWPEIEQVVLDCEFKAGIEAYLATRPDVGVRCLADLIRFNQEHAAEEMPYFQQEIFERAQERPGLDSDEYRKALADSHRLSRTEGIDATLAGHSLDALVAPPRPPASTIDLLNGPPPTSPVTQPAAMAGYPIITVPAGWALDALPLGLVLFAGPGSEAMLLGIAHAFERYTNTRRAPRFRPTLDMP